MTELQLTLVNENRKQDPTADEDDHDFEEVQTWQLWT
jgi:hypothetical protein